MKNCITVIVDNKSQIGLKNEHGLAIYIEYNGQRILFDNGQNKEALFYNAEQLNIPLTNLDFIILSHGHYDHSGNLDTLLKLNPNAHFYAHPDCLQTRYSLHPNKAPHTISIKPNILMALSEFADTQKHFITNATEITPGMWLTGQIPRIAADEDTGGPFFLDTDKKQPDLLNDDMSLWLHTEDGIAVICGCCHSGIINTLTHIKQRLPSETKMTLLLGGLHLVHANKTRIDATIDYLNQQHIDNIYPAHCTGDNAQALLQQHCANVHSAKAGITLFL
ncbi:MBL fold metallo-hydrolase [Psychromonas sp. PT13]|uniref:MBL fold metallo-hydrolase n=1 Tax=Psychromonas sp. PT13 TaxID=3439547 RepID=UPI003EB7926D